LAIAFRKAHPNIRRRKFYQDREVYHSSLKDIAWYNVEGKEMSESQWNAPWMRSLAVMFNGTTLNEIDETGQPIVDDSFLLLLNSHNDPVTYTLPQSPRNLGWGLTMDTSDIAKPFKSKPFQGKLDVYARSFVLLREMTTPTPDEQSVKHEAAALDVPASEVEPAPASVSEPTNSAIAEEAPAPDKVPLPEPPPLSKPEDEPKYADPLPVD
jgi:glycogen operon protein